jgi:beta-galactosidase beta subunit
MVISAIFQRLKYLYCILFNGVFMNFHKGVHIISNRSLETHEKYLDIF